MHEVIALQACELLEPHREQLQRLDSFQRLQRWRDCIVEQDMLGRAASLAACAGEPANSQEERPALVEQFEEWEKLLADGLRRMRAVGALCADVEPEKLATGIMAALQGGYLLARVARDNGPLTIALDMAISQVKSLCREEQCNVE